MFVDIFGHVCQSLLIVCVFHSERCDWYTNKQINKQTNSTSAHANASQSLRQSNMQIRIFSGLMQSFE